MTPQNDAKYTSLLFTPRTTESARGLPDYRWGSHPATMVVRAVGGPTATPATTACSMQRTSVLAKVAEGIYASSQPPARWSAMTALFGTSAV